VLKTVQQVLIGDNKTTEKAIDAFVKAILAPKKAEPKRAKSDERDLDLLNRKIKATLGMMADPTFDGMDELQSTLADLKAKRDALTARLKPQAAPAKPEPKEDELRAWALKQFAGLHELTTRTEITLQDRQLVEAYVERIEIYPETKTGVVVLSGGLENAYREGSTRLPIGDFMGAHEWCFYGWKEGAAHTYLGPNNATDLWHVKKVNPQSMVHLTEKPVELAVRAMQYSSRTGENVLDLFGGSGSTLIAAQQTGRRAFLMELDPLYCDVIVQRYEQFTGQKAEYVSVPTVTV
jgi:hypothetical protein